MAKRQAKAVEADRHLNPRVAFHLESELMAALDEWRTRQRVPPGRSDVIRQALRDFLEREGLWPAK